VPKISLANLPWKVQLAVFVTLSLASAGAFYYFYEMPVQERVATREQELASIRTRINKGLTTARQLPEFRKEVAELQARLEGLKPILPEEKDAADLLRRVNTLAVQSNLTIRAFRPQAIATKTMHAEWPIALDLEGSYHNLGLFLDRVSKFPRIINVGGLDIRTKSAPDANGTIEVTCTATTFVLIEPQEAAASAKKKGKGAAPAKTE
jgi:type IV pilus assembly protein PilO